MSPVPTINMNVCEIRLKNVNLPQTAILGKMDGKVHVNIRKLIRNPTDPKNQNCTKFCFGQKLFCKQYPCFVNTMFLFPTIRFQTIIHITYMLTALELSDASSNNIDMYNR